MTDWLIVIAFLAACAVLNHYAVKLEVWLWLRRLAKRANPTD